MSAHMSAHTPTHMPTQSFQWKSNTHAHTGAHVHARAHASTLVNTHVGAHAVTLVHEQISTNVIAYPPYPHTCQCTGSDGRTKILMMQSSFQRWSCGQPVLTYVLAWPFTSLLICPSTCVDMCVNMSGYIHVDMSVNPY